MQQEQIRRSKFIKWLQSKPVRRAIGYTCLAIAVIGLVMCMYLFDGARVGIPIGFGIVAVVFGLIYGFYESV